MKVLSILLLIFSTPVWGESDAVSVAAPRTLNLPAAGTQDGAQITLRVRNWRIRADVASTEDSREHGLMQRTTLCRDCGMLFVFERPDRVSFWMKDTQLALSIAFIDADGRIISIEDMAPGTVALHTPGSDALYALEMNRGWFQRHRVRPGDQVQE